MNMEDFLDKELDTGNVGSIDNIDRNPRQKEEDPKEDSGGIFSKKKRKNKFKAWFDKK